MQLLLVALLISASAARHFYPYSPRARLERNDVTVVDEKTGIKYNPYSKHHPGRHVCTNYRNVSYPTRTRQVYCKPTYKKYMVRCGNQWCEGVRLVYEKHHKDIVTNTNQTQVDYACCPGWTQVTYRSHGCNKPVCDRPCLNGGKCVRPNCCHCPPDYTGSLCEIALAWPEDRCSPPCQNGGTCNNGRCDCPSGFEGFLCEKDIDECKLQKPCDQICHNSPGSFRCECKESFILDTDGQSCRKEIDEGTTLEAKDLEFQRLDRRLNKLEKVACCFMMSDKQINQVTKKDIITIYSSINRISSNINAISGKLKNLDSYVAQISSSKPQPFGKGNEKMVTQQRKTIRKRSIEKSTSSQPERTIGKRSEEKNLTQPQKTFRKRSTEKNLSQPQKTIRKRSIDKNMSQPRQIMMITTIEKTSTETRPEGAETIRTETHESLTTIRKRSEEENLPQPEKTIRKRSTDKNLSQPEKTIRKRSMEKNLSQPQKTFRERSTEKNLSQPQKTIRKRSTEKNLSQPQKTARKRSKEGNNLSQPKQIMTITTTEKSSTEIRPEGAGTIRTETHESLTTIRKRSEEKNLTQPQKTTRKRSTEKNLSQPQKTRKRSTDENLWQPQKTMRKRSTEKNLTEPQKTTRKRSTEGNLSQPEKTMGQKSTQKNISQPGQITMITTIEKTSSEIRPEEAEIIRTETYESLTTITRQNTEMNSRQDDDKTIRRQSIDKARAQSAPGKLEELNVNIIKAPRKENSKTSTSSRKISPELANQTTQVKVDKKQDITKPPMKPEAGKMTKNNTSEETSPKTIQKPDEMINRQSPEKTRNQSIQESKRKISRENVEEYRNLLKDLRSRKASEETSSKTIQKPDEMIRRQSREKTRNQSIPEPKRKISRENSEEYRKLMKDLRSKSLSKESSLKSDNKLIEESGRTIREERNKEKRSSQILQKPDTVINRQTTNKTTIQEPYRIIEKKSEVYETVTTHLSSKSVIREINEPKNSNTTDKPTRKRSNSTDKPTRKRSNSPNFSSGSSRGSR